MVGCTGTGCTTGENVTIPSGFGGEYCLTCWAAAKQRLDAMRSKRGGQNALSSAEKDEVVDILLGIWARS